MTKKLNEYRTAYTHASLFSGIGGAEIAAEWVGWQNAFHVEINPFCRKVLEYWYPNSISYEDITETDFSIWRGKIDVLTGGFPCQPFSLAGMRKGTQDNRYLWPQMLRAIREIKPSWVVGENVAGILTMVQPGEEIEVGRCSALFDENHLYRAKQQYVVETVCQDLEREGYSVQPFVIPACAVGAPHRRYRVWIIAHRADAGVETVQCGREDGIHATGLAADTDSNRQRKRTNEQVAVSRCKGASNDCSCSQDGTDSHSYEYRHTPCRDGGRTETEREERFALPGEREVWSQRSDRLPGLQRVAIDTECVRRNAGELHDGKSYKVQQAECREKQLVGTDCPQGWWWSFPTQSPVCRRDDGVPFDVDKLTISFAKWRRESIKAYGNAWVPQVAFEIFIGIDIEMRKRT